MKLIIRTFWHGSKGWGLAEGQETQSSPCIHPNGGGWKSVEQMQAELMRRNAPHNKPEIVPNGVKMEGHCGTFQIVTLET